MSGPQPGVHPALEVGTVEFRGWRGLRLANGLVQIVAVPDIGGRIMACDLLGQGEQAPHPFLFVDPALAGKLFTPEENQGDGSLAAWKNYGGDKTWPAPQGWDRDDQWHGPPDPVLDTGRYSVEECAVIGGQGGAQEGDHGGDHGGNVAVLSLVSPPDARTGLQIVRRIRLHPQCSRITLDLRFRNIDDRRVRWSIWDVVQLAAGRTLPDGTTAHDPTCVVTAPVNPKSRHPRGFQVMFGAEDNPQWTVQDGLFVAPYQWQIGKVGLDSTGRWIAFSQGSQQAAFVERFAVVPDVEYPDDGSTVECWTVGAGQVANLDYSGSGIYLMETEVLSPFFTIDPGHEAGFALEWACCRCVGPIVDVQPGGCAGAPLTARRIGGGAGSLVRVAGSLGVFEVGDLLLAWLDAGGRELGRQPLGAAGPLAPVELNQQLPAPDGTAGVHLLVRAARNGQEYPVAAATVSD